MPSLPCLSRPVHAPWLSMHYAATRRLEHAHMTVHAYECARELQAHSYACTARLIRGDGSVACTCALREQTACIRRYFACASDSAGVHMNERTQSAFAARIRTAVVRACIATCEQKVHNLQHGP